MYELQLFNHKTGHYVPADTGDNARELLKYSDKPRRVILKERDKELPLKPRIPYGLSGKPRKYRPETMIEPAPVDVLIKRAVDWYEQRAANGERGIKVYAWNDGGKFAAEMRVFAAGGPLGAYQYIELDPAHFEPVEENERAAA